MRIRASLAVAAGLLMAVETASACSTCHRNPCVAVAPQPAYQCVTEMVPYTVYKKQWRTEYDTVSQTVMERVPVTNYVERQRVVCKPVYDTVEVPCQRVVCKPIHETDYVTQNYTVCKPVQTTRQVTEYCMQPSTQLVTVPAGGHKCLLHHKPACGECKTVAQTTYTPVPVVKDVVVTQMVRETQTRQVPVTRTRYVQEVVNEVKKVTHRRMVQEVVTERVPVVTWTCQPRVVTKQVPRKVCEQVAVTCYKPVKRVVPVTYAPVEYAAPAPQAVAPAPQAAPSGQVAPSKQI
jgi:hypothetical protein